MLDPSYQVLDAESMKRKYSSEDSVEEDKSCSSSSTTTTNDTKSETKKTCVDCGTSKTPLWRGGPAGPKSLCNACGIRSRKRSRAVIGGGGSEEKKLRKGGEVGANRNKIGESLKQRLFQLGRDAMLQGSLKLGEEEQAAVLLMALSYGSVYA